MLCWSVDLFPKAIRSGRAAYGYSLDQVAEYLMMTPERISALEAGSVEPLPQEVHNFETLYGVCFLSRVA
jgi:transcriptional regulator with XRE-family HTH domain